MDAEHSASHAIDVLRDEIIAVVAAARTDPYLKPFATLLAAAQIAQFAAEANESMRVKLAHSLVTVLRGLAPELVVMLPHAEAPRAH